MVRKLDMVFSDSGIEFTPQYPTSLVRQITKFLRNAIIEGQLEGGQRLVENELQRRFGVSRAPIRESFRILEESGLLVTVPRKGTCVRKVTRKEIEENFPIRAALEGLAARLAVSHLEEKDIKAMESALSQMAKAARGENFSLYHKCHFQFHEIFIRASNNDTLIGILEKLRHHHIWFSLSYRYFQESFEYDIDVHRQILEHLIKKDIDPLDALVKEHILIGLEKFLQFIPLDNKK
jgi:DNA-binding GntR family transcriptional regulator